MDPKSTKTAEYLSSVADANGEDLPTLLRSTGIDIHSPGDIRIGAVIKLRDNYGASPVDLYDAIDADLEAAGL